MQRQKRDGVQTECEFVCAPVLEPTGSVLDELGGVFQPELVFDVFPIGFDSLDAEMELGRDLAAAQAGAQHVENLEFAVRERFQ